MTNEQVLHNIGFLTLVIALPFNYAIQIYFYKNFLGFKNNCWKFILYTSLLAAFNLSISKFFCNSNTTGYDMLWLTIINDALWFLIVYFLCKGNFFVKLYAVIVQDTILLLITITFLSLDFKISSIVSSLNIPGNNGIFIIFMINIIREAANLAINFILLFGICKLLSFRNRPISLYQGLYLLVPCLSTYGLVLIFYMVQQVKINNNQYYLFSIFFKIYYLLPLISISLLISILITVYTFKKMLEGEEIKQRNMLIEQQFKMQTNHNKNTEKLYSGIKSVMHDMNNHIVCLRNLAEDNNIEEVKKYLGSLSETVSKLDLRIKTGNSIADAVINEKYNIAKTDNIEFVCDLVMPSETLFNQVDICVILSNALDNAIEACRKITDSNIAKKICIKSFRRDMYFIMEISNSSISKIKYAENKIVSEKMDKANHGIGISNIQDVVRKYNGIMDIVEEKNKFIINLMFKIKGDVFK